MTHEDLRKRAIQWLTNTKHFRAENVDRRGTMNPESVQQGDDEDENETVGSEESIGYLLDYISGKQVKATPEEKEAVQIFARRLVEDFGYDKHQIITHPQYRISRSPSDEAKSYPVDIAVFSKERKTDDSLFLVIECKEPKREDGIRQLKTYLDLCPATLGAWFNGKSHCYLQKFTGPRGTNDYREIPTLPLLGQRLEDIGKFYRQDIKPTTHLRSIFKDIRFYIAGNTTGVTRDETIAGEIINVLFCKIYDEMNTAPTEILRFRHGINEDRRDVGDRIRALFKSVKTDYSDVFQETDTITLDDKTIAYVVGELQNFSITDAPRDAIGDSFEVFIGPALKGSQGQFFTPRNIVRAAVEIVNPKTEEVIIDPACGSGGFLIVALEHVWNKLAAEEKRRGLGKKWLTDKEDAVAQKNFRGIEKDSFLAKITKAYMAIVGDGRGGVFCENSLAPTEWGQKARAAIGEAQFDVIFTNPPFGAKIKITDPDILKLYDLGHRWVKNKVSGQWEKTSKTLNKQVPQILFIERCYQLLKPGGRLAIVLPDGILGGAKIGYVPSYIQKRFEIIAGIDCPLESFSPNTTTKVHLLVLQKRTNTPLVPRIFLSVPDTIGHDKKGEPIYADPHRQIVKDDLDETLKLWKRFSKGEDLDEKFGFSIKSGELEEPLNAKRYLPEFMKILRRIRAAKNPRKLLCEVAGKLRTGANVDNLDYVASGPEGTAYILVKNVLSEGIIRSNLKFIKRDLADSFQAATAAENDIVINRCGDVGVAAIVPKDLRGAIVCGFCFVMRAKPLYDPNYIAAFLNSPLGVAQLKRVAIGSILQHITKDDLKAVTILFPEDDKALKDICGRFAKSTEYRRLAAEEIKAVNLAIFDAMAIRHR
jgi:type I restriction enzyme M protein